MIELALQTCLPDRSHPAGRVLLEHQLSGTISTPAFLRWFHMPNSYFLPVGQCLLAAVTGR